jgi:HAE1 family hydrophobic/amphiphilic exporter-1
MIISDFAIKRPMITVVTMVALVVFGLFALWRLQTDEFPDIQQPVVLTFIPYPGASPEGVEREILKPVEDAIKGISGVDKIYGTAGDGYAQIITLFLFEKDPQIGSQDIRDAISGIRSDLPVEMKEPVLQRFDPSDQPIVSMTIASPALTPAQLTRLADPDITSKLRGIPGIAQVQLVGGVKREMTIQLRPQSLQAAGISVGQVVGALEAQNLAAPVGRLNGNLDERTIRLQGRLEGPQEFMNLVVERNGQIVRLGRRRCVDGTQDSARSRPTTGLRPWHQHRQGEGLQHDRCERKVRAKVAGSENTSGRRRCCEGFWSPCQSVDHRRRGALIGALLTVLVVFVFSTLVVDRYHGPALPVSVMASFIAVWAFGLRSTRCRCSDCRSRSEFHRRCHRGRENIVRHIEMLRIT